MTTEPILSARAIVRRYLAHGIPARVYRDAVIVHREAGWVGPLDPLDLQATHLADIERIEADARVAAVLVLCREASGWKQDILERIRSEAEMGLPYIPSLWKMQFHARYRPLDLTDHLGSLLHLLQRGGCDHERATLYTSVAFALHGRHELFRDLAG